MSDVAIKFENISKQYRLGLVSTKTLSHDLNRWWQTHILHKEDPYLRIGESNDRSKKGKSDYVWALRNIDFEVERGEVLGIVGKNGAGKSTLLKILSRVTTPTTGTIKAKGRIASLLEVGTGFHPELTGRENIYMNGSIMGMTKSEITRKLDEIVEFAGVARYIDTPVKRYSSGMIVRLGFSVAAHLEPEILVVDEVLAVGDAEFQQKAIGKMQDVSKGEGRTVLFVSHNMGAVGTLCTKGILLEDGMLSFSGTVHETINHYLNNKVHKGEKIIDKITGCHSDLRVKEILVNGFPDDTIELKENNELEVRIKGTLRTDKLISFEARIFDERRMPIAFFSPGHYWGKIPLIKEGDFEIVEKITLPVNMNHGFYTMNISLTHPGVEGYLDIPDAVNFEISGFLMKTGYAFNANQEGILFLK
jgi:lipopolysaccharide transport system ATP-binding protein